MRPLRPSATPNGRIARRRLLLALLLLPLVLLAVVPPASGQDGETVDLYFRRITTVVWGNGTVFNEFQVDVLPGDAVNATVEVGVARNRLRHEHEATLRVRFSGNATDEARYESTFRVGPSSRNVVITGINITIPRDTAEGRYELRFTLDIGALDPNPATNEKIVPVLVGEQGLLERILGAFFARIAATIVVAVLVVAGIAWAFWSRRPAVQHGRERLRLAWESLVVRWVHHPRHGRNRALLGGGLVLVLLLWLVRSEFFVQPTSADVLRQTVIGLRIGALYALIALGYTMVYGVLKFINFAHGEVFMWGAYFLLFLSVDQDWLLVAAALGAILLAGALGLVIERVAYRPLRGRPRLTPLITAIGVSLFLQAAAQLVFGTEPRNLRPALEGTSIGGRPLHTTLVEPLFHVAGVPVSLLAALILFLAVACMVALHLFVRHSRFGTAMRAVADDMETASIIGIDVDRVVSVTFVVGSMLAAVAGILFAILFTVSPSTGLLPGIKAFTAAVVGGIGNIYGAFLGGFLIGIAENVGGAFIDSRFKNAIAFFLLVFFLVFRPTGIMGAKAAEVRRK